MKRPIHLRLLDRTQVDDNNCWNWQGCKDKDGYGVMRVHGKFQRVHRLSFQHYKGGLTDELVVRHTCDNPGCTNPEHLLSGTQADNQRDKKDRGRVLGSKHPYSKLTETDVIAIRASALSQSKLAGQYGTIQAHISRIKRRVNWTHI